MAGLAAGSVIIIASLTAVFPQPPMSLTSPFGELAVPLLLAGYGVRNLGLALGMGPFGLIPFLIGNKPHMSFREKVAALSGNRAQNGQVTVPLDGLSYQGFLP